MFHQWLRNPECGAYNSFGNGSAMRVSSVAWLYNDLDAVRHAARLSAEITHNHPEGIKGAEATASAIYAQWPNCSAAVARLCLPE